MASRFALAAFADGKADPANGREVLPAAGVVPVNPTDRTPFEVQLARRGPP